MLPLLIEMPRLFERFLQRLLEERLPGAGLSVRWGMSAVIWISIRP